MRTTPAHRLPTLIRRTLIGRTTTRHTPPRRRSPDAGLETADKILWAAGVVAIAGVVVGIFRDDIEAYARTVMSTLGL